MAGPIQLHDVQVGEIDPQPAPPPLPGGAAEVVRFFMEVPQWLQIAGAVVGGLVALAVLVLAWRRRKAILRWVAELPGAVKATAIAVVLAAGAVASVGGYQTYDFVEHDNRFCTGCHLMSEAYVSFDESAHTDLGCKACHAQSKLASARQLYLWVLDRPQEVGPHSPVSNERCSSCHIDENPDEWPQVAASLGHQVHFESDDPELEGLMCVNCHGVSVHEFTPVDATCGECHVDESQILLGAMAGETALHCAACHDFLGEEPAQLPGAPEGMALLPDRAECQSCHSMAELLPESELDADPHGAVCGACHNPHEQDAPGDAVAQCTTCHEGSDTLTIFHTGTHAPVHAQCTECHSAHTWSVEGNDCLSCHESVLEEPAGPQARAPDPSQSPLERPIRAMQPIARLAMHGAGRLPGDLFQTPSAPDGTADLFAVSDTIDRPFSHAPHEGLSCAECHGSETEHGVVTVQSARDCAACHHDPGRNWECASCHGPERMAGERSVTAELEMSVWASSRSRALPFEHERHESLECARCHTDGVMLAPSVACAECHDDHHRPEAECSLCHEPAPEGTHGLDVHLTCTSSGCHAEQETTRPTLSRSLCLTCHTEQRDHEPGLECQQCHMIPDSPPSRSRQGA